MQKAVPYPTTITVPGSYAGLSVSSASVILHGLTADGNRGSGLTDGNLLLVAPNGKALEIMGEAGSAKDIFNGATFTIADSAATKMPSQFDGGVPFPSACLTGPCSYKPTSGGNNGAPTYPATGVANLSINLAQPLGTGTFANVFVGAPANGVWQLFMADGYKVPNGGANADLISFTSWDLILKVNSLTGSSTTVSSSQNPSFTAGANSTFNLSATVNPSTATGTVGFTVDGVAIAGCGSAAVGSGVASCNNQVFAQGNHTIVATYSGDSNNAGSFSVPFIQYSKQRSTLAAGQYCNTGPVTVTESSGGVVTMPVYPSVINVGTDTAGIANAIQTVTVTLKGFSSDSLSLVQILLVGPGGKNLGFMNVVGDSFPQVSRNVTFTDTSSHGLAPSTGSLTQPDYFPTAYSPLITNIPPAPGGAAIEPQVPASINLPQTAAGANSKTFTTAFSGGTANGDWGLFLSYADPGHMSSLSGGWCLSITAATGTPTDVTVSGNPNALPPNGAGVGTAVTITSTVKNHNSPGTIVNEGSVTFTDNGSPVAGAPTGGTINVVNGVASFSTSLLTEGDHTIMATYNGTVNYGIGFVTYVQRVDNATTTGGLSGSLASFCNPAKLNIPGLTNPATNGPGGPNPSNIFVDGLPGTLNHLTVSLKGYETQTGFSTRSLLVGPAATALDFLSDAGGNVRFGPVNVTIDDAAGGLAPQTALATASYRPASYDSPHTFTASASSLFTLPGSFTYAAPGGAGTLGNVFGSGVNSTASPDGLWSLYFYQNIFSPGQALDNGWCLNFTLNLPDIELTGTNSAELTDSGNFKQGGTGTYTIAPKNNGPGVTGDTPGTAAPAVAFALNANLTYGSPVSTSANWTCAAPSGQNVTCTYTGPPVAAAASFPALAINVGIGGSAPASASSTATFSGGGDGTPNNNVATRNSTVIQVAHLSVTKTHNKAAFTQGGQESYNITVHNSNLGGATTTQVMVEDILPASLTYVSAVGTGWACTNNSGDVVCTTNNAIAVNTNANVIVLTVDVAVNAVSPIQNTVVLSGGGGIVVTATSVDTVTLLPLLSVVKTHTGVFTQGQTGGEWDITISNGPGAGATSGTTTVTDTLPTGYTVHDYSNTSAVWSCTAPPANAITCTSTAAQAGGTSFPVIKMIVNVPAASPVLIMNTAMVSGGGNSLRSATTSDVVSVKQVAASITVSSGNNQSVVVGSAYAPLQVLVMDAASVVAPGVTVTFAAPGSGASGSFGPAGTITGATNASPIVVAVTAHGYATGDQVQIAGVLGNTAANGTFTISVTDPDHFSLNGSTGNGAYSGGGNFVRIGVSALTNINGFATAPTFTANSVAGPFTVTASAGALSAPFSLTNIPAPDLTVSNGNGGAFTQGAHTGTWTVTVHNTVAGNATSGTVTVTDTLPTGYSLNAFTGTGWNCNSAANVVTCTTSQTVSGVADLNVLNIVPNVPANSAVSVTNNVSVSGGGELNTGNDTASNTVTVGQVAATVSVSAGNNQAVAILTAFAPLKAVVKDAAGVVIPGAAVTFAAVAGGSGATGTFAASPVMPVIADVNGIATAPVLTANNKPGGFTVTASVPGATSATFNETNTAGAAASLTATAGTPQSAAMNAAYATALQAKLLDASSNPVQGAGVTFTAPGSGASGTFGPVGTITGATNASPIVITLTGHGYSTGDQVRIASILGNTAANGTFSITATDANHFSLNASTGNGAYTSGGTSSRIGVSVSTDVNGFAIAPTFTANGTSGPFTVTASVGALSTTFNLTNVVSTAPTADSVTGIAGGSLTQNLAFKYSSVNGFAYLNYVYALFNSSLNGAGACWVSYQQPQNAFYLIADSGVGVVGPLGPNAGDTIQNGQCTLARTGTSVSGLGNTLTVNAALTFKPSFGANQTIFMAATDLGGLTSGWQNKGTTGATQNTPPTADSITPTTGDYTLQFSSVNGYAYLTDFQVLFNSSFSGVNGCLIYYLKATNSFYLVNDAGTAFQGPLAPNGAGTLSNTQCTLTGTGSALSGTGNTLTATLKVTFNAGFGPTENIYMYVMDAGGQSSGWVPKGNTAPNPNTPPTVGAVTGMVNGSLTQTITFNYASVNGGNYLSDVYALFNGSLNGGGACWIYYDKGANALFLFNDSATGALGPLAPGSAGTLQNKQCTLNGTGSSVNVSGNNLTMVLSFTFSGAFGAVQNIYAYAADQGGLNSGWQSKGTTGTVANTPPTADSVTGMVNGNANQTLTFQYSSDNGFAYIQGVYALINTALNGTNACWVYYDKASTNFFLVNDAGTAFLGPMGPNAGDTLPNGHCTLKRTGTSVSGSGNALTMTLNLSFQSFTGAKGIFLYAADEAGMVSGWQQRGTVTLP